jgi:hypothetical protein
MARFKFFLRLTYYLVIAILKPVLSQAPKDPLLDFCRRFSHQTALINRRLYLDGGYVNANPLSQNPRAVASMLLPHRSTLLNALTQTHRPESASTGSGYSREWHA